MRLRHVQRLSWPAPSRPPWSDRMFVPTVPRGSRLMLTAALFGTLVSVCPHFAATPLRAQTVIGRVVEAGSGQPIQGSFVQLFDIDGVARARVLTGIDGRFVLRVPTAGSYSLQAEQIGFSVGRISDIHLGDTSVSEYTIPLQVSAVVLDQVSAVARARCRIRPESGPETEALWREARKALNVIAWRDQSRTLEYGIATFRRLLERSGRPVRRAEPDTATITGRRPFTTLGANDLVAGGFIRPADGSGSYEFHAPDAAVLLSDPFLETHCFWVERPRERWQSGLIGLAFEPIGSRSVSDIRGVLWLDAASGELRVLEFSYTGLPWDLPDGEAAGRVAFDRTAAGDWIIANWSIRIPRVSFAPNVRGAAVRGRTYQLIGYEEAGGEIRWASSPLASARRVAAQVLYGTVFDSTSGTPLAGARVALDGTGVEAETDLQGRYRLADQPPGAYSVILTHPRIDQLGIAVPPSRVQLRTQADSVRLDLAIGALASIVAPTCPSGPNSLLTGFVRDSSGRFGIPGALIRATWRTNGIEAIEEDTTDERGIYRLCNLAGEAARTLEVSHRGYEPQKLTISPDSNTRQIDIALERRIRATLSGRAVDASSGAPVVGAAVVIGSTTVMTDSSGRFVLGELEPGTYPLSARHEAYGTVRDSVDIPARTVNVELTVQLASEAIRLAPLEVITQSQPTGRIAEVARRFQESQKLGLGKFIWRDEIEKRHATRLTQLLRDVPGLEFVSYPEDTYVGHYIVTSTRNRAMKNPCKVHLLIDGHRVTSANDDPRKDEPFDLLVPVGAIEAVEVYIGAAEIPPELGGSNFGCGVVAVWTR